MIASRVSSLGSLAMVAIVAILMLPGLVAGPSLDAAVFQVAGWQMAHGDLLYVDAWDHKPPGIHAIHALAGLIPLIDAWSAAWLLTVAASAATAATIMRIARRHVSAGAATVAGIGSAIALGHYVLSLGGGMSESFAALPAAAALAMSAGQRVDVKAAAVAGVLTALSVIVSPQLAPVGLACVLLLAQSTDAVRRVSTYLAAGTIVLLALIGLLAVGGSIPAFVDAVLSYNSAYRQSTAGVLGGPSYSLLPWVTLSLIFLVAPAALGAMAARRRGGPTATLALACLVWIAGSVMLTVLQGRLYGHYALAIVVPLALLAAIGLDDARVRLQAPAGRVAGAGILGVLVFLSLGVGGVGARMELDPVAASNRRAASVARWVRSPAVTDHHTMLVWGNQPYLYRLSNHAPAIRYSYLYPLATRGYATPALIVDIVAELEADPPRFIVDAGSPGPGEPGFLPLLEERPVATDGRDLDLLDPVRSFVDDRYDLAAEVDGWLIYRLRESAPGSGQP